MSSLHFESFDRLPLELAQRILELLDPIENCLISQTNKFWRELCNNNDIWRNYCKSRFQLNDITTNGFKKLAWTYPGVMTSWKDWFAFRSQFRREVAGSVNIEALEILIETPDKIKRIPAKYLSANFTCFSQPPQSSYGSRNASFHFDEYHTLIQCEFYENKSWFYNRHCGKVTIPVFQAKQHKSQVWVELDEEDDINSKDDIISYSEYDHTLLSDDERDHSKSGKRTNRNTTQSGFYSPTASDGPHVTISEYNHFVDIPSYDHSDLFHDDDYSLNQMDAASERSESDSSSRTGRSAIRTKSSTSQRKSKSAPNSPKRGRRESMKSVPSSVQSPASPSSSSHLQQSSNSIARPSSPSYSTMARPISPVTSSSHLDFSSSKRRSSEIKSSKEVHTNNTTDSLSWFGSFLSISPPPHELEHQAKKKTTKRVLLSLTLTPVAWSVQDFEMVASISHGAFNSPNELLLVRDKDTNKPWFMKIVPTVSNNDDSVTLEGSKESVAYSTSLSWNLPPHPFIVDLYTTFQTDNKLYLLMEWFGGGELFSVLRRTRHGRFDESVVFFYAAQLILGIEHMHNHKIIYRDLKPENLLLSAEGHLKITQRTPPEQLWDGARQGFTILTAHSLPEYLAPEILKGQPYSTKSDSWSVGTILYHMLVGQPPFHHPNVQSLFSSIINDEVSYPSYLSSDIVNFLKGLLHRDAKKRLPIKGLRNHEYFAGLDWNRMLHLEIPAPVEPFRRQDLDFAAVKRQQQPTVAQTGQAEVPPSLARHMSL